MPRRLRCHDAGYVFHVLNRGVECATIFDKDVDYAAFEKVLGEPKTNQPDPFSFRTPFLFEDLNKNVQAAKKPSETPAYNGTGNPGSGSTPPGGTGGNPVGDGQGVPVPAGIPEKPLPKQPPPPESSGGGASGGGSGASNTAPQNIYNGIKNAPNYPVGFKAVQNGTSKNTINNTVLLAQLREIESGKWYKVYKDGYVSGKKVSIHYFESESGKVFDVAVKPGWSNL